MANFDVFFPTLLQHEGGFVNDPVDPGGATNKGITFATFNRFAPTLLGVQPSLDRLRGLTDAEAAAIYKAAYWDAIQADAYPSQKLANFTFDFYVNAGGNAVKVLQQCLRDLGQPIAVDGAFGPNTLKALQAVDVDELYQRYKLSRVRYYQDLVTRNRSLKRFLNGWMNRVNSFPD